MEESERLVASFFTELGEEHTDEALIAYIASVLSEPLDVDCLLEMLGSASPSFGSKSEKAQLESLMQLYSQAGAAKHANFMNL